MKGKFVTHPLEALFSLQKRDIKLIRLLREINDIPLRKEKIESHLTKVKIKLNQAIESRKKIETRLKDFENETEIYNDQITKYKQQSMDAETNDQYRAFLREISSVEENIKEVENQSLSLMEDLEKSIEDEKSHNEKLKLEEESISDEINELDNRYNDLEQRVSQMKEDRLRVTQNCDQVLLNKYTRILRNKKDKAIVLVESGCHCGGCHMQLPPQVINDAKNPSKIVSCNFCGRIVYNPPE